MYNIERISVSVIIPCFNCSAVIERAINSILLQDYVPLEVILIDDASSDNTLGMLHELSEKYKVLNIKVFAQYVNSGPSAARNLGWKNAKGDYIAFLDADDAWHPSKLKIQYDIIKENESINLIGHYCSTITKYEESSCLLDKENKPDVILINKFKIVMRNRFPTPSIMMRRDLDLLFDEDKKRSEDYLLWSEVACKYGGCYLIKAPLGFLFKSPYGASGLSADLFKMQKGQLDTLQILFSKYSFHRSVIIASYLSSYCRFLRRLCFKSFRAMVKKL